MRYTHDEVKQILSGAGVADPHAAILGWLNRRSLIPVDPDRHPTFVLSFPVEVSGRTVATVTLASETGDQSNEQRVDLMCKYMGVAEFFGAHQTFSHETYQWCYLQVHEEFEMPEVIPGMQGMTSHFRDAAGNRHEYSLFWGAPEDDADLHLYSTLRQLRHAYCFDGEILLRIGDGSPGNLSNLVGHNLGEEINRRIADRARAQKVELVTK